MRRFLLTIALIAGVLASAGAQSIPTPEDHLGFRVGTDRKLADWQQIVAYFKLLGEHSNRIQVEQVGLTTEGNPFLVAIVSSPDTLGRLEEFREIQAQLADPRRTPADLSALIERGKTIVMITCGIHSTEVASPQMAMEFAWDLAVGDDSQTQEILDNVIFLFVPSLNPDGVNIVNHWYWETLSTPAEGTRPPQLYQKYVGHDNNRDWYMFTQQETRLAVEQLHNRWHPQIVYDVHQMGSRGARIFVPPFIDPVEPNVDPLLQAQIIDLGGFMFSSLIASGRRGVVTQAIYDAFTPARAYQHYHGGVRILSESASANLATPITVSTDQLGPGRNFDASTASWNFPVPWEGGEWHLRDIVDDQKVALRACLLHAARNRRQWLTNFYQVGMNAVNRTDFNAFLIPPESEQTDPQGFHDLLATLDFGLVEFHRSRSPFEARGSTWVSEPRGQPTRTRFPAGTIIVRPNQPYSAFAKTMLEVQHYPELRQYPGGPLRQPYDVTAHTLGIQLGVEAYQATERVVAELEPLTDLPSPSSQIAGEGNYWLFSHKNNAFAKLASRLLKSGVAVHWAPNGFEEEGTGYPVGTLMASVSGHNVRGVLENLPVRVDRVKKRPQLAWQQIRQPRIGVYQSWATSMDEGWTRWILEQNELDFQTLHDKQIRAGLEGLDVVVFADQSAVQIREGLSDPYPEEFRGGLGSKGLRSLRKFVEDGGSAVFLGAATSLPREDWGLAVSDVTEGVSRQELYIPGSLLRLRVNPRHPLGFGLDEEAPAMFVRSRAFESEVCVSVAEYATENLLLSGWVNGESIIGGKSSVLDCRLGKGKIVLIGFRSQFRAQARATYKFLFNSLFYATAP